ncbi:MAG: histone deacetylase [Actinomycetota bacterium]|nr:histone deacetylase [Actinomycetota bacterium]
MEGELEARGWLGLERREAPEAERTAVTAIHPEAYVDAIRAASEAGGGSLDADTVMSAGSYRAALHAAGGACAMVDELLAGNAPFAFCAMRPPGHHAERATAMGFCLFNNAAIAAQRALERGVQRVLVLDWDVHHGNGTNDIFHSRDDVLYASIHQSPLYPGTGPLSDAGSGSGEGFSLNLPVPPGSGEATFVALVQHVVAPAARAFRPGIVLVSAGYDAHRDDPLALCELEDGSYAALGACVRDLARELDAPVGVVLEGGYALGALARSVAATIEALGGAGAVPEVEPDPTTTRAVEHLGRWWPLAA